MYQLNRKSNRLLGDLQEAIYSCVANSVEVLAALEALHEVGHGVSVSFDVTVEEGREPSERVEFGDRDTSREAAFRLTPDDELFLKRLGIGTEG